MTHHKDITNEEMIDRFLDLWVPKNDRHRARGPLVDMIKLAEARAALKAAHETARLYKGT
jgi:hypothetical protein